MTSSTAASQSELKAAKVPLGWRDQCSACVPSLPSSLTLSGSLAAIARRQAAHPPERVQEGETVPALGVRE